ncbi:MAG: GNAT family N-acetyltransferase [Elainellaceae cyanobacterium]
MTSSPDVTIEIVTYRDATADIQTIRRQVFQQEQGVSAELEFDGLDDDAIHLLAYHQEQAVGTCRLRNLGEEITKVERVAVLVSHRGQGIGRQLMVSAIDYLTHQGVQTIKISAQTQVEAFYERLGFETVGEVFQEAGIPHVTMWLSSR